MIKKDDKYWSNYESIWGDKKLPKIRKGYFGICYSLGIIFYTIVIMLLIKLYNYIIHVR